MPLVQPVICPVFIGRAAQMEVFQSLMAEVGKSLQLRILLVSGEAGIGKTRFTSEMIEAAKQRGITVLRGRCFEQDQSQPYAPLADLLNAYCTGRMQKQLEALLKSSAPALLRIFPELSMYLPDTTPLPMLDPEAEKQRIFQAMTGFLIRIGGDAPLLIVIEDLHWCDDLTLEFLSHLTRRNASRPILLAGAYRADERHESLERLLTEWNRMRLVTDIQLPRLSLGEADNMLRAILSPDQPLRYDLLEALYRLTEGNPFFLEEALKALIEAGDLFQRGGKWENVAFDQLRVPRTVQLAVQNRLSRLSPEAERLAKLAAVIGRRFNIDLLQSLTNQSSAELTERLHELIRAQLIVEETAETFLFRHALTREAIYQNILGLNERRFTAPLRLRLKIRTATR